MASGEEGGKARGACGVTETRHPLPGHPRCRTPDLGRAAGVGAGRDQRRGGRGGPDPAPSRCHQRARCPSPLAGHDAAPGRRLRPRPPRRPPTRHGRRRGPGLPLGRDRVHAPRTEFQDRVPARGTAVEERGRSPRPHDSGGAHSGRWPRGRTPSTALPTVAGHRTGSPPAGIGATRRCAAPRGPGRRRPPESGQPSRPRPAPPPVGPAGCDAPPRSSRTRRRPRSPRRSASR